MSADDKTAGTFEPEEPRPKAAPKRARWLIFLAGLLLPLLLLGLVYLLGRGFLEKYAPLAEVDPLGLQTGLLESLQTEIDEYRAALSGDVCAAPPPPGGEPFFARPEAPGGAPGAAAPEASGLAPENAAPPPDQAAGPPPAEEDLAEAVERATVMILAASDQGEVGTGTGFFIAPDKIMTNYHVIGEVVEKGGRLFAVSKTLGGMTPARVLAHTGGGAPRDYAILSVEAPPGLRPAVLELAPAAKRAERVSSWGYPIIFTRNDPKLQALMEGDVSSTPEVVYSEGVVSVVQEHGQLPFISHTAEVSHGNSGGPLVNRRGQVVGINTMIQVDENSSRQVNIALGSRDILAFVSEQGLTLPRK
ncbi:MAG: serine protease [Candidatus Adiutrix sp.]|jgi:S1-C subfamily serine protease|nr:serine protease [Candidatus Adiutrix sp.]